MTVSKKTHVFDLVSNRISAADITGFSEQCVILVSNIYPIISEDDVAVSNTTPVEGPAAFWVDDVDVGGFISAAELRQILKAYVDWPIEDVAVGGFVVSGELRQILKAYVDWPIEDVAVGGFVVSGELDQILVEYSNWPAEDVSVGGFLVSGTLS